MHAARGAFVKLSELETGEFSMANRSKNRGQKRVMMRFATPEKLSDSMVLPTGSVYLLRGWGRL